MKEERGEKVLQVLDQFPPQFMEDQTRPSVSMAVYRRPHSGSGKPGNLAARQAIYPLQTFKSKGKFSVLDKHSNKLAMFISVCGYSYQEKHLLCVLKHIKIN